MLQIDGKYVGPHLLLFALGIGFSGKKHVLGIWEGSTEHHEGCLSLLGNLIERDWWWNAPVWSCSTAARGSEKPWILHRRE